MVLVLNRNWQAVNIRTPQEAFCMMATNVATGLEIEGENHIRPVTWDEWITLPIRPQDNAVQTVRGPIRVPTVIVAVNYAKVPQEAPEAVRPRHSRARRQPLPIHRPCAAPGRGQPGPRCAPLARRQGRLGEPGLGWQGRKRSQGQPPAARGRPEAAQCAARAEGIAGIGTHPQRPRYSRVEAVCAGINQREGEHHFIWKHPASRALCGSGLPACKVWAETRLLAQALRGLRWRRPCTPT